MLTGACKTGQTTDFGYYLKGNLKVDGLGGYNWIPGPPGPGGWQRGVGNLRGGSFTSFIYSRLFIVAPTTGTGLANMLRINNALLNETCTVGNLIRVGIVFPYAYDYETQHEGVILSDESIGIITTLSGGYVPDDATLNLDFDIKMNFSTYETVAFGTSAQDAGSKTFPDTSATFAIVGEPDDRSAIADGYSYNGTAFTRYASAKTSYILDLACDTSIVQYLGFNTIPTNIGDGDIPDDYKTYIDAEFGTIGMKLSLGNDEDGIPIVYSADSTSATEGTFEGIASANTMQLSSDNRGLYMSLAFSDLGKTWQYKGSTLGMDGEVITYDDGTTPIVPIFEASNGAELVQWNGDTSPEFVRAGVWTLEYTDPGTGTIDYTGTNLVSASGHTINWGLDEAAPTTFSLTMVNPGSFNGNSTDDTRVLIQYPRNKHVHSVALADHIIDAFSLISGSSDGIGGWTAVNCSIALSGGKIVISDVLADAYIYRKDYYGDNIDEPYHWTSHRFAKITCDVVLQADDSVQDWKGNLKVMRTANASPDTMTKICNKFAITRNGSDECIAVTFDTCNPSTASGGDTAQSYFTQALPEQTKKDDDPSTYWRRLELSNLSWSWGIGCFDRIELTGLEPGYKYTISNLTGLTLDAGSLETTAHPLKYLIAVNREFNTEYACGDTEAEYSEDNRPKYFYGRVIGMVNGRYGFEAPYMMRTQSPTFELDTYTYFTTGEMISKTIIKPTDDMGHITFSDEIAHDASYWLVDDLYTDEKAIFAKDVCPVWWYDDVEALGDASAPIENRVLSSMYARPIYDTVTIHPFYVSGGTGTEEVITFYYTKRLRGRATGIVYHNGSYPIKDAPDAADTDNIHYDFNINNSSIDELFETDRLGVYYSQAYRDSLYISSESSPVLCSPLKNRTWFRCCIDAELAQGKWLAAAHSKRLMRNYLAYNKKDSGSYLRLYNHDTKMFEEREISATQFSNVIGMAIIQDRTDKIKIVYDDAVGVYYIETDDQGKTWGSAVEIVTGGTNPQIAYSPVSGTEIVTYFRAAKIRCKRKLGTGSYGAEIDIADSADMPAPITYMLGARKDTFAVAITASDDTVKRWISNDSGRTWALDV